MLVIVLCYGFMDTSPVIARILTLVLQLYKQINFFTATARASIPAYNRRSTFLSSRLVTPMEFAAI